MRRARYMMLILAVAGVGCGNLFSVSCGRSPEGGPQPPSPPPAPPAISRAAFGSSQDGQPVETFTLRNANGIEMRVISLGGIITHLKTPDRAGALADIVLGLDSPGAYLTQSPYFGAIIGRYGNRIGKAAFTIDGTRYPLAANNG